jgi:hypothetical protein
MKVYEYESYEQYVEKQTMANKAKIDRAWIVKSTVAAIKNWYVREYDKLPTKILCHGTRNGAEQKLFKSLIGNDVEVLGTARGTDDAHGALDGLVEGWLETS